MKQDKLRKLRLSIFAYSIAGLILGGILLGELLSAEGDYFRKTITFIEEYLCDKGILPGNLKKQNESDGNAILTEGGEKEISGEGYGESSEKGKGSAYEHIPKDSYLLGRYRE